MIRSAVGLLAGYAAVNPHATFVLIDADGRRHWLPTNPTWPKWVPTNPTSPHWHTPESFRSLTTAHLAEERRGGQPRRVSELIADFRGLSGSAKGKKIAARLGLTGQLLSVLATDDGLDQARVDGLLRALQDESRPVQPQVLGIIGDEHLTHYLVETEYADPGTIRYKRLSGTEHGLPWVLEIAFGALADEYRDEYGRTVRAGINFAPMLGLPFPTLRAALSSAYADIDDPVNVVVHLTCPRLEFLDHGKSSVIEPPWLSRAFADGVKAVTADWSKLRKRVQREQQTSAREVARARQARRSSQLSIIDAANQVMEQAYIKASDNGRLPANARQVMYAARPLIMALTGGRFWKQDRNFTQDALPDYLQAHSEETRDWDVVYDDRGHFAEPHGGQQVGLGTLAVRRHLGGWRPGADVSLDGLGDDLLDAFRELMRVRTAGPADRYGAALFLEKEGFAELLDRVNLANRYDLAIFSTKGTSVTAARQLVERLSDAGIPIFVVHDFDAAGFTILRTLQADTRRYSYRKPPQVIDLGLRLDDVEAMQLESEPVEYAANAGDPRPKLREAGATAAEIELLVQPSGRKRYHGQRVELNAMTSAQFVAWLERKLAEHGVTKVVPSKETLDAAYRRAAYLATIEEQMQQLLADHQVATIDAPDDIAELVEARVAGTAVAWDEAVSDLVRDARV